MSIPAQSNSLESQVDRRERWASFCLRDHPVQPWEKRNFLVETQAQLERAASQKTVLSAIFKHLICSIFNESPLGMRIKGASPLRVPRLFASPSHVTFSREHRCFFDSMAHMAAGLLGLPVLALRLRVIPPQISDIEPCTGSSARRCQAALCTLLQGSLKAGPSILQTIFRSSPNCPALQPFSSSPWACQVPNARTCLPPSQCAPHINPAATLVCSESEDDALIHDVVRQRKRRQLWEVR